MFNTIGQLSLAAITLFGAIPAIAESVTPQTSIQEVFIEGDNNLVDQQFHQTIVFGLISIPNLEESVIPRITIQNIFDRGEDNQVNQQLTQTIPNFFSFNGTFNTASFGVDDFLNNDATLEGLQFSTQETFIEGNNNLVTQNSTQNLTNFFVFDESFSKQLEELETNKNGSNLVNLGINQFLYTTLNDAALDAFQVGIQDIEIFGNNNLITQHLNQTITNFLLVDDSFSEAVEDILAETTEVNNFLDPMASLKPIQLAVQETFIDEGTGNTINQEIEQFIAQFFLLDVCLETYIYVSLTCQTNQDSADIIEFDIDKFITTILFDTNTTVDATQVSRQIADVIGNNNQVEQENIQMISVSIPEPASINSLLFLGFLGMGLRLLRWLSRRIHSHDGSGVCQISIPR